MTHHVDYLTPFVVDGATIASAKSVKLLGVYIDSELSMTKHVSSTVSFGFFPAETAEGSSSIASFGSS